MIQRVSGLSVEVSHECDQLRNVFLRCFSHSLSFSCNRTVAEAFAALLADERLGQVWLIQESSRMSVMWS